MEPFTSATPLSSTTPLSLVPSQPSSLNSLDTKPELPTVPTASLRSPNEEILRDPESMLHELLKIHEDLRTWLQHTGYFDADHRYTVLSYVQELRGLDKEKDKVLTKIRDSRPANKTVELFPISAVPDQAENTMSPTLNQLPLIHQEQNAPTGPSARLPIRPVPKRDTRYFLIKSSNTTNVYMSRRDSLWITQAKNGSLFTQAHQECKSVVLFFSINKSKAFQGYAKMTSLPDHNITPPSWITATAQDMHITPPFHVDWINESETPFTHFGNLKNPFNEYHPVFVGRDGQEYSEDCGRRMMQIMDRTKAAGGLYPGTIASSLLSATIQSSKPMRRLDVKRCPLGPLVTELEKNGLGTSRWNRGEESVDEVLESEPMDSEGTDLLLDF